MPEIVTIDYHSIPTQIQWASVTETAEAYRLEGCIDQNGPVYLVPKHCSSYEEALSKAEKVAAKCDIPVIYYRKDHRREPF